MASEFDFLESFSERAFTDRLKKIWTSGGAGDFTDTPTGRFGIKYYRHNGFNSLLVDFGGSSTQGASGISSVFSIGAGVRNFLDGFGGQIIFQNIGFGQSPQSLATELISGTDGRLFVSLANGGVKLVGSDLPISLFCNVFYFIEWEVTFHESADLGLALHSLDTKCWVDGIKVIDSSGIVLSTVGQKYINCSVINFGSAGQMDYSDMYFRTAGAFGKGLRVLRLKPNGDSIKEFQVPVSGDHYIKVDETLLDTTDYVEATGSVPVRDVFTIEDVDSSITTGSSLVYMTQFEYYCEGTEGGDSVFSFHYISGAFTYDGVVRGLTGLYNRKVDDSSIGNVSQVNGQVGGVKVRVD